MEGKKRNWEIIKIFSLKLKIEDNVRLSLIILLSSTSSSACKGTIYLLLLTQGNTDQKKKLTQGNRITLIPQVSI